MPVIRWAKYLESRHIVRATPPVTSSGVRTTAEIFVVALIIATAVAACTPTSVIANKSDLLESRRQVSPTDTRGAQSAMRRDIESASRKSSVRFSDKHAASAFASYGLASFYTEGARTASGDKFDPHALTAAHPSLPFGTRLQITNVATGQSVVVRVNDRGPFIPGRIVDVSYSAAKMLGIIGKGTAKVKLAVVP